MKALVLARNALVFDTCIYDFAFATDIFWLTSERTVLLAMNVVVRYVFVTAAVPPSKTLAPEAEI